MRQTRRATSLGQGAHQKDGEEPQNVYGGQVFEYSGHSGPKQNERALQDTAWEAARLFALSLQTELSRLEFGADVRAWDRCCHIGHGAKIEDSKQ